MPTFYKYGYQLSFLFSAPGLGQHGARRGSETGLIRVTKCSQDPAERVLNEIFAPALVCGPVSPDHVMCKLPMVTSGQSTPGHTPSHTITQVGNWQSSGKLEIITLSSLLKGYVRESALPVKSPHLLLCHHGPSDQTNVSS